MQGVVHGQPTPRGQKRWRRVRLAVDVSAAFEDEDVVYAAL